MFCKVKNVIMWALTYKCNMSCKYCFLRDRVKNQSELSEEECINFARLIASDPTWRPDAVWLTGGEPTIRKCIPRIINILENANIRCVITTNGFCNANTTLEIISASPRGINVSLDPINEGYNNQLRGKTQNVINTIKMISHHKNSHTILGVSSVISQKNIYLLFDFAKYLKSNGVEYLSINPLIGNESKYTEKDIQYLIDTCEAIRDRLNLSIPSKFYFNFLTQHLSHNPPIMKCPAGDHFFFIAPWGEIFPCSNEMWHNQNKSIMLDSDVKNALSQLQENYRTDMLTTCSPCFGDRCIGCWKLYYDTIFS